MSSWSSSDELCTGACRPRGSSPWCGGRLAYSDTGDSAGRDCSGGRGAGRGCIGRAGGWGIGPMRGRGGLPALLRALDGVVAAGGTDLGKAVDSVIQRSHRPGG